MASVTLKNITKVYSNGVKAVSDFDLEVEDKEFIIFVGPSGCGKSTTLRMIAGLEEITEGELYIDGNYMNDMMPKDRDIAMVFQNYALYPHMNVFDNMAFGLKLRKVPKPEIKRRVSEAAQILGLEDLLDRRPKELSGGQRQRVAMGRAIVREPKVFLMDEPLSNLDAKLRVQMRTEITKLHKRLKTTFIYVTHDQIEAMTLGTRIVVMLDGLVQQTDTPANLYNKPLNMFVAGFIGSPQMNFIDATVVKKGEDTCLDFKDKSIVLDKERADALDKGGYIGKDVVMGIRPEHLHDEDYYIESAGGNVIELEVTLTGLVGAETYLYLMLGEQQITARVSIDTKAREGQPVTLAFDMGKIHVFDKETELAVC
ncbi:MAG: sn-glycerol-3-phosphate ABC transporter ATP-binding protein UgpC [Clostridiales bacterium]|nr:sn-glycerol-3-phosphate ABC transporter ATP-binding protein UgpC [Clostridiales bacterium]